MKPAHAMAFTIAQLSNLIRKKNLLAVMEWCWTFQKRRMLRDPFSHPPMTSFHAPAGAANPTQVHKYFIDTLAAQRPNNLIKQEKV